MKRSESHYRRAWWMPLALVAFLLLPLGQAIAADPSTTQAYCNAVKQAAKDAEKGYVKVYTMKTDPQQVFHDATAACMSRIVNYQLRLPTMDGWIQAMDGILKRMAEKLMNQVCQAATDQFQKEINRAQRTIDDASAPANDFGLETGLGGLGSSTISGEDVKDVISGNEQGNPVGRIVNPAGGSRK